MIRLTLSFSSNLAFALACSLASLGITPPSLGEIDLTTAAGLLRAAPQQIRGIDSEFTFSHEGDSEVRLKWDIETGRVNALTATHVQGNPYFRIWVRNAETDWHGQPEEIPNVPDTWHVEVRVRTQDDERTKLDEIGNGLSFLKMAFIPYHMLQADIFSGNITVAPHDLGTDDRSKHSILNYAVENSGKRIGTISYECDFSDGVRIYSTLFKIADPRAKSPVLVERFEDFEKTHDVWIAKHFTHDMFDPSGNVKDHVEIRMKKIEINPVFKDDDFVYSPTLGSRVDDARSGLHYRAGYKDPHAQPGEDERDTRALDAKIKRLKAAPEPATKP